MRQRGRQSTASLQAIPVSGGRQRLAPPHHLNAAETKLFREVVTNAPAEQFSAADVYLLTSFVRVTLILDDAAKALAKADDSNRPVRMKMLDQAVKMQALLASKLRLATQSRLSTRTAGRQHDGHKPSAYDFMDWEDGDDDARRGGN